MDKHYKSLSKQLMLRLIVAFIIGLLSFSSLCFFGTQFLDDHFAHSQYILRQEKKDIDKFQSYISKNHISANDSDTIYQWFQNKDFAYMNISRNNALVFDSIYLEENLTDYSASNVSDEFKQFYRTVSFADGNADVFIYNNYDMKFYVIYYVLSFSFSTFVFLFYFLIGVKRRADYIRYLSKEVSFLETGYWEDEIEIRGNDDLSYLGFSINTMRKMIQKNTQNEIQRQHSQNKLITSIAHDLRTPLTSLTTYLDLLQRQDLSPDSQSYIRKCKKKTTQITELSDQLFEYFFIHSQILTEPSLESAKTALTELLFELVMVLKANGFHINAPDLNLPPEKIKILSCYMQRIQDNIISNIKKYADKQAPISLSISQNHTEIFIKFSNSPRQETSNSSRSEIGLRNIQLMMEQMDGKCIIENGTHSFSVILVFQKCY